jgi:hypothetical protein
MKILLIMSKKEDVNYVKKRGRVKITPPFFFVLKITDYIFRILIATGSFQ